VCYLAALAAKIVLGSFSACDTRSGVNLRHDMTLAVCRSAWDGFIFGLLQALAPVFFRGNWAESFFGTAGQRILFFWQPYRQKIKTLGKVRARAWPWMLRA